MEFLYSEMKLLYGKKERLKELICTHSPRRTLDSLGPSLSISRHTDNPRGIPLTGRGVLIKKK